MSRDLERRIARLRAAEVSQRRYSRTAAYGERRSIILADDPAELEVLHAVASLVRSRERGRRRATLL